MIAFSLGTMAMAVVMTLFLLPLRTWYTTTAEWMVDSQARIVREKMLHQIRPGHAGIGLRSASRTRAKPGNSSVSEWVDFAVDPNPGTASIPITTDNEKDDESWRIQWNKGLGLVSKDTGQPQPMVPDSIVVNNVAFTQTTDGRILTSIVAIQSRFRGTAYTRNVVTNVYLINP